jgi:curved DNA-binding protein CbpA
MIGSHRAGEITYYDELGVTPDASSEQIRDAFRLFVRLLHPDQQTDPQLKDTAEQQMRKLNRVYAVLSDPESRRRYDENLDEHYSPPIILNPPSRDPRRLPALLAWASAIVVSAVLLIWMALDDSAEAPNRSTEPNGSLLSASVPAPSGKIPANAANQDSQGSQIIQLQSDLRAAIVERDAAIRELNRLRGTSLASKSASLEPHEGTETAPASSITEPPPAPKIPASASQTSPRIDLPASPRLAGFWFYAKPPQGQTNKNQSLYPPEYIEATITEDAGVIRGRFRSRFQIVDRAISPDVNFTFTGTPNGPQINCPWTGAGGAKGDLTLKLTSENSMRIDWSATELGTQQGLNSGTAVLTRRIE